MNNGMDSIKIKRMQFMHSEPSETNKGESVAWDVAMTIKIKIDKGMIEVPLILSHHLFATYTN